MFFQLVSMIVQLTPFMPVLFKKLLQHIEKQSLLSFLYFFIQDYHKVIYTGSLREKIVSLFYECIFKLNLLSLSYLNKVSLAYTKVLNFTISSEALTTSFFSICTKINTLITMSFICSICINEKFVCFHRNNMKSSKCTFKNFLELSWKTPLTAVFW